MVMIPAVVAGLLATTSMAGTIAVRHEHTCATKNLSPEARSLWAREDNVADNGQEIELGAVFHFCCASQSDCPGDDVAKKEIDVMNKHYATAKIKFTLRNTTRINDGSCSQSDVADNEAMDRRKAQSHTGGPDTLNIVYMPTNEGPGTKGVCIIPPPSGNIAESVGDKDGCVVSTSTLPSQSKGDSDDVTSVHEAGHWLSLEHTQQSQNRRRQYGQTRNIMEPTQITGAGFTYKFNEDQVTQLRQTALRRKSQGGGGNDSPPKTPYGPGGDDGPKGPGNDGPKGPGNDGPKGPGNDGPQGPGNDGPQGPGNDGPKGPGNDDPDGLGDAGPEGPDPQAGPGGDGNKPAPTPGPGGDGGNKNGPPKKPYGPGVNDGNNNSPPPTSGPGGDGGNTPSPHGPTGGHPTNPDPYGRPVGHGDNSGPGSPSSPSGPAGDSGAASPCPDDANNSATDNSGPDANSATDNSGPKPPSRPPAPAPAPASDSGADSPCPDANAATGNSSGSAAPNAGDANGPNYKRAPAAATAQPRAEGAKKAAPQLVHIARRQRAV